MDINIMHLFIVILCIFGVVILSECLRWIGKSELIVGILVLSMVLLINAGLFSLGRLLTLINLLPDFEVSFLNWWSIFIRMQTVTTVCGIGYLTLKKIREGKPK
jgi:hypothetical protein